MMVTGSTRGIGQAICERFAAEGASVVVTGRSTDDGRRVAAAIRERGGRAAFTPMDIAVENDVQEAVRFAVENFGGLTTLINNAAPSEMVTPGIGFDQPVADLSAERFAQIINVGLVGTVHAYRHALPVIRDSGGGSVVTISSATSIQGAPGLPAYSATKGALNALTRQIAVDYGADGIRVNALVVGFVMSGDIANSLDAHPEFGKALRESILTRTGRPEDVAAAAVFLASDDAEFITGACLVVDGGLSVKIHVPTLAPVQ
ncbi:SDR family oxidoreductase [Mycobacterium vicinigordonae]|uniref:SDR family oxidoreductase n=2 Tax=Mycobacterium vicinigordonae TaxID=1719132 RepID=A0A7D6E8I2_9MYCO|nr:SDR family oxidoreductase [Mycobacterium vicinigordonae]